MADAGEDPARHGRVRARRKTVPAAIELAPVGSGTGSTTGRPASDPGAAGRPPGRGQGRGPPERWFAGSGVGIVSLHVFEPPPCRASGTGPSATTPLVAGVPGPQRPSGRSAPEVRSGWPSDRILEVAGTERADMITLAWRRRLAPDRAAVVRDVLARTPVPVILLPHAA